MGDHQETAYAFYHEWKSWSSETFGIASAELHAAYAELLRKYTLTKSGDAIDFGFGNGEMLSTLRTAGFRAIGIERNPYLREIASRKGYAIAESLIDDCLPPAGTVGVITALHVLEHLDKDALRQTLTRFAELLKSGGIVLAAFPNGDSPFSAGAFNGDITHVTWIGSSMAEQIGAMSGLKLAAFHAFPSPSVYSPRPLVRFKGMLRASMEAIVSGFISRVYYGSGGKVLAPVIVAVWIKQ